MVVALGRYCQIFLWLYAFWLSCAISSGNHYEVIPLVHVTYKINIHTLHICSADMEEFREGGTDYALWKNVDEGRNEGRKEDATLNSCSTATVSLNPT